MNLRQIRWPVVLLVMMLGLGGLFGAGYLLKSQTVDQPLRQMLEKTEYVDSYKVERIGEEQQITVRLKEPADLKAAYNELDESTRQILRNVPFKIKVEDRRTPELEQAARRLDLHVQEALATGQFTAMADRLQDEATKVGATARVGVDSRRVYVAIQKGDGYLYSVVERAEQRPLLLKEGGFGL